MILFIDEQRSLKIVRTNAEEGTREVLGKIRKPALEMPEDLSALLQSDEHAQVLEAIELLRVGEQAELKALVAQFPEAVRKVLTYYMGDATQLERRWVLGALLEGLRVIRRFERETAA